MAENTQREELPLTASDKGQAKKAPCNLQASFTILNKYGTYSKRLRTPLETGERGGASSESRDTTSSTPPLSAVRIMRMAQAEISRDKTCDFSVLTHGHAEHMRRAVWLLDAAEKFSERRYDEAEYMLILVRLGSYDDCHPIGRVVEFFARDLMERIDTVRGRVDLEREVVFVDVEEAVMEMKAAMRECEQKLPFTQISHFTGIQIILDTLASAGRIHFIDVGRKIGSYWILMMDALANRKQCGLEQLKITAVCSRKDNVEEAGNLLTSYAASINLPFVFKILYSELHELKKDRLELEAGEAIAVYMELYLSCLSPSPKNVEGLVRELKCINPHVMVVYEIEANAESSTFIGRFHEAVFHCSAMFDCLYDCLGRDSRFTNIVEKLYFQEIIRNGIIYEDHSSFKHCRRIDFWREYFAKFRMVETELSQPSVYQASLMIGEHSSWKCCTLTMNEKSMLIGWNGVPLRSVSAWKFRQESNSEKDQNTKAL